MVWLYMILWCYFLPTHSKQRSSYSNSTLNWEQYLLLNSIMYNKYIVTLWTDFWKTCLVWWSWPRSALIIAAALTHTFNQFCFTAEIAKVWKLLTVQPLFKGCDMVESNSFPWSYLAKKGIQYMMFWFLSWFLTLLYKK